MEYRKEVVESEEYKLAVKLYPAEELPDVGHPEGGLERDGRGEVQGGLVPAP